MFKKVAEFALRADATLQRINLVDKNSYIRYVIPFMKLPKFDNRQIVREYVDEVTELRSAVPYSLQPRVSTGLITVTNMDTSLLKLIIKDNRLVDDPEHRSKRQVRINGSVIGLTAGLYGTIAWSAPVSDIFMAHPIAVVSTYLVLVGKMIFTSSDYESIETELNSATDATKLAFEFAVLAALSPLTKVHDIRKPRKPGKPGKPGKLGMSKFRSRA